MPSGSRKPCRRGTSADARGYAARTAVQSPKYQASSSSMAMRLTSCHGATPCPRSCAQTCALGHRFQPGLERTAILIAAIHHDHDAPVGRKPCRIATQPCFELVQQVALALKGVDLEAAFPGQQPRQQGAQERIHRRFLDQQFQMGGGHDQHLRSGRLGAPWLTSGSPTPSWPSIHNCPSRAPC